MKFRNHWSNSNGFRAARDRAAPSRDRKSGGSAHALSPTLRRSAGVSHFPRKRATSSLSLRRSRQDAAATIRRLEEDFRSHLEEEGANALSQPLTCRWFNLALRAKDDRHRAALVVFGKPRLRGKRICIDHPEFEVIESMTKRSPSISAVSRRFIPRPKASRSAASAALFIASCSELSDEPLETLAPDRPGRRRKAPIPLQSIHFPEGWDELKAARQHLVLLGVLCAADADCGAAHAIRSSPGEIIAGRASC